MTSQDDLALLKGMHQRGEITDEQYDVLRRHVLWGTPLPNLVDEVPARRDPSDGYVPGAATVGPGRYPEAGDARDTSGRYAGEPGGGRNPMGTGESAGAPARRYASRRERREAEEAGHAAPTYLPPTAPPPPSTPRHRHRPTSDPHPWPDPAVAPASRRPRSDNADRSATTDRPDHRWPEPGIGRGPATDGPNTRPWSDPAVAGSDAAAGADRSGGWRSAESGLPGAAPAAPGVGRRRGRSEAGVTEVGRRRHRADPVAGAELDEAPGRRSRSLVEDPPPVGRPRRGEGDGGRRRGDVEGDRPRQREGDGDWRKDRPDEGDAEKGAERRRPHRRSVFAVLTSVVLALALAAGGVYWFVLRTDGPPPAAYARDTCGAVRDWQQSVDSSNATLITQISRQQNKTTVRTDVTAYYTTVAGRTDQLRTAILALGAPDITDGREYADSLAAAVGDQATGLRRLAERATSLNPASASFPTDLQTVLAGADSAVSAVTAALARPAAGITTELRATLSNEPICAPYVG